MIEALTRPGRYFVLHGADGVVAYYHEAVHGFRERVVLRHVEGADLTQFPRVEVELTDNPDCLIPADAVPIADAEWAAAVGVTAGAAP